MLRTNILVLGKSGAGKSSLLNYLWGKVVAETGVGRPVTQRATHDEIGIFKHDPLQVGGVELVIYDSWGMEADKADEWNKIIRRESQSREKSANIEDWFHAIIYCVSAKGARIEEFEIKKIVEPLLADGHAVIFALTKCGLATEEEQRQVREAIDRACPSHSGIISVESVEQKLRGRSTPTMKMGQTELLGAVKENFVFNLRAKLKKKYLAMCDEELHAWKSRVLRFYDQKASYFKPTAMTLSDVAERAIGWLDECLVSADKWREAHELQATKFYAAFSSALLQLHGPGREHFLVRKKPLTRKTIEWDGFDHATSFVMNFLPVVNVAYWIFRKDVHRSFLGDKLQAAISAINEQARHGLA